MKAFFSIIIPTYNRADMLQEAINSVINQFYQDWELIIIDDGSTDNTKSVVTSFNKDHRIKYKYQDNKERSAARNHGISIAEGQYICFLDDDDYFLPNHLQLVFDTISDRGFKETVYIPALRIIPSNITIVLEQYNLFENVWNHGASIFIIAPSHFLKRHNFDESLCSFEDFYLLIILMLDIPCHALQEVSCVVRSHNNRSLMTFEESKIDKQFKSLDLLFDKIKDNHREQIIERVGVKAFRNKYFKQKLKFSSRYAGIGLLKKALKSWCQSWSSMSYMKDLYFSIRFLLVIFVKYLRYILLPKKFKN